MTSIGRITPSSRRMPPSSRCTTNGRHPCTRRPSSRTCPHRTRCWNTLWIVSTFMHSPVKSARSSSPSPVESGCPISTYRSPCSDLTFSSRLMSSLIRIVQFSFIVVTLATFVSLSAGPGCSRHGSTKCVRSLPYAQNAIRSRGFMPGCPSWSRTSSSDSDSRPSPVFEYRLHVQWHASPDGRPSGAVEFDMPLAAVHLPERL